MAPAAIHDQVGKAILTTGGLAVHLEAGFGLGRCSGSGTLLEAGAFRAGSEASHIRLGDGGEAEHQEC
jgi:hypothetical protein